MLCAIPRVSINKIEGDKGIDWKKIVNEGGQNGEWGNEREQGDDVLTQSQYRGAALQMEKASLRRLDNMLLSDRQTIRISPPNFESHCIKHVLASFAYTISLCVRTICVVKNKAYVQ
jgi:hypothetical protein